jgi:hypothetical protein
MIHEAHGAKTWYKKAKAGYVRKGINGASGDLGGWRVTAK